MRAIATLAAAGLAVLIVQAPAGTPPERPGIAPEATIRTFRDGGPTMMPQHLHDALRRGNVIIVRRDAGGEVRVEVATPFAVDAPAAAPGRSPCW